MPEKSDMTLNPTPKFLFLAGFDPLLLGYKDKERFLKPEYHHFIFKKNGFIHSVLLYEGQTIGVWNRNIDELNLQLFEVVSKNEKKLLINEVHHIFRGKIKNVNFSKYG